MTFGVGAAGFQGETHEFRAMVLSVFASVRGQIRGKFVFVERHIVVCDVAEVQFCEGLPKAS